MTTSCIVCVISRIVRRAARRSRPDRLASVLTDCRASHHSQRGQALIEFTLAAPLIIAFLFTIVDVGIALDRRIAIQHAVREGARRGAVTNDISSIINTTVAQSQGLLNPTDVSVCYVDTDGNGNAGDSGDSVRVSATFVYNYSMGIGEIFNALGASVSTGLIMTPSAEMRLENSVFGAPACL